MKSLNVTFIYAIFLSLYINLFHLSSFFLPFKDEMLSVLVKDPGRTAQKTFSFNAV